jgi:DUF2993 family protein
VIRRFLIAVLIFIIAVLVAADRVGALVAAHVLAGKVQSDEHLPTRPSTSIDGIPFLTQALSGKYKDVTIKADNVPVDGVSVTMVTAHLHGVHIPFSHALHDSVEQVPVDAVDGTAFISFGDINAYLSGHHPVGQVLSLKAGTGDNGTVLDRLRVGGQTTSLRGVGTISLANNVVKVKVTNLQRTAGKAVSAKEIQGALKVLRISLPLRALPFRIQLTSVSLGPTGVTVIGGARDTVLGSPIK